MQFDCVIVLVVCAFEPVGLLVFVLACQLCIYVSVSVVNRVLELSSVLVAKLLHRGENFCTVQAYSEAKVALNAATCLFALVLQFLALRCFRFVLVEHLLRVSFA